MQPNLGALLTEAARQFGDKTLLIGSDRSVTFQEMERLAIRFAGVLAGHGIRGGDRVTLWLENGWRWMVAYYAILKLGAVVNPVNALLTVEEVDFILRDCGSAALIAGYENGAALVRPGLISIIVDDGNAVPRMLNFDRL